MPARRYVRQVQVLAVPLRYFPTNTLDPSKLMPMNVTRHKQLWLFAPFRCLTRGSVHKLRLVLPRAKIPPLKNTASGGQHNYVDGGQLCTSATNKQDMYGSSGKNLNGLSAKGGPFCRNRVSEASKWFTSYFHPTKCIQFHGNIWN